jgi:hypothetical protein
MGACSISMTVKGDATEEEVMKAFANQQQEDRYDNGHREGYSGDFQTVDRVKFTKNVFTDGEEAFEYCLSNAQKWSYVVAVKVVNTDSNYWLIAGWGAD